MNIRLFMKKEPQSEGIACRFDMTIDFIISVNQCVLMEKNDEYKMVMPYYFDKYKNPHFIVNFLNEHLYQVLKSNLVYMYKNQIEEFEFDFGSVKNQFDFRLYDYEYTPALKPFTMAKRPDAYVIMTIDDLIEIDKYAVAYNAVNKNMVITKPVLVNEEFGYCVTIANWLEKNGKDVVDRSVRYAILKKLSASGRITEPEKTEAINKFFEQANGEKKLEMNVYEQEDGKFIICRGIKDMRDRWHPVYNIHDSISLRSFISESLKWNMAYREKINDYYSYTVQYMAEKNLITVAEDGTVAVTELGNQMGIRMETVVFPATKTKAETTSNIIMIGELAQIIVYNYLHLLYNKKLRLKYGKKDEEGK